VPSPLLSVRYPSGERPCMLRMDLHSTQDVLAGLIGYILFIYRHIFVSINDTGDREGDREGDR